MKLKDSPAYAFALYGAVGFQLAVSVVAGIAFGNYVDGKAGTSPVFIIIGALLGTFAGIWNLIRILKWNEKEKT